MKKVSLKLLSLFISIMMVTMLLPGLTAKAATTPDGMFYYEVSEGNATIHGLVNQDYSGPLNLPSTISDGTKIYKVTAIGDFAFDGCAGLSGDLTIPNSVTSIGDWAFEGCSGLNGPLTIPDSVTRIGDYAFAGCTGLTGLTIGSGVTSISDSAFDGCNSLTGPLTIPDTVTIIGFRAFARCTGLEGLTLGSSVTTIGGAAFSGCSGLTGPLTIPGSVTSIHSSAFINCSNITDINVSSENPEYSSKDGIIYNKLQSSLLICPAGRMGSLTIPNSVAIIGDFAFDGCTGLSGTLTIPDSVTRIGEGAFFNCSSLTGITIGNSVTRIETEAFGHCHAITDLTLGYNLTFIGVSAFMGCSSINKIIAKPINAPLASYVIGKTPFESIPNTAILYTPNTPSSNTSYNVSPWSKFVRGTLQPTAEAEVVSGVNRFDTAALISKRLNDSANTVILTTGRNFPDALSAGPLAVQKNAPILLAEVNKIPIETLNEITRLGASKVIILGGLGAMDSSVEATLKNLGLSVERISGATRFLTAIETAKQVRASSGQLDRAILANGYGFADALSIGSYAAKAGIPILLTAANSLSPETKTAMVQFGIKKVDIIGGELAVSKAVESQLQAMGITVSRISGASRFATSSAIAGMYFAASENAIVSNGRGFVDALAAVPLAVKQNAPILLVEKDSLPVVMSNYLGSSSIKNITITGGELAVSSTVKNQILNILNSGDL